MAQSVPKLYYWPVKARCVLPVLIWSYGGVKFDWEKNPEWPAMKEKTPFGQLPYVEFGDVHFAQSGNSFIYFLHLNSSSQIHLSLTFSGAIARFAARQAGLQGDNDADFATSEQLIEEFQDLFNALAKANYSPDKAAEYDKVFNEVFPAHFDRLEKLLGDKVSNRFFFLQFLCRKSTDPFL